MHMYDVITFGSATRDVFLRTRALDVHREHGVLEACLLFGAKLDVDELTVETGGGATNNAVSFSRLAKMKVAAVTKIGNDSAGGDIVAMMKRERIHADFVQRDAQGMTGYSSILLSSNAERTILTYRGVSAQIEDAKIPWSKINAKLFHVSSLGGDLRLFKHILDRAERIGAKVYWNPGSAELKHGVAALSPLLKRADLVSLNRDEVALLTGIKADDTRGLIKAMRRLVCESVITDGENGAYSVSADGVLHSGILKVDRINITGAGDAFFSAYALGYFIYHDRRTALALGTINATGVVQKMGAKVGILSHLPHKNDLKKVKIKRLSI